MKKIFTIIFLMTTFLSVCQNKYRKGVIHFKNGDSISGFVKDSGLLSSTVKFKKTRKGEKQSFDYKKIKFYKFFQSNLNVKEYHFKKELSKPSRILKVEKILDGKLELFCTEKNYNNKMNSFTFSGTHYEYYLCKNGSTFIKRLPYNPKGKLFRRVLSKFISDNCKDFKEKIKDKKTVIENYGNGFYSHPEIISDYNETCN